MLNTQKKLRSVGFKYEDGVFMQTNYGDVYKVDVIRDVMHRADLNRHDAEKFIDTAAKLGRYNNLWNWK
jgi:hypothetical protein